VLTVVNHPLVAVHVSALRDKATDAEAFRRHMDAVGRLLVYPALAGASVTPAAVETPLAPAAGWRLTAAPVLVPILRAGLGLVDAFLAAVPGAVVSHLGVYRDHQRLVPVPYFDNFAPEWRHRPVIVLDPMLATGGSAVWALTRLKAAGVDQLTVVAVLAAPEGLERLESAHSDVRVFVAAIDQGLDSRAYIVPGLGDAGDRLYGTAPQ